MKINKDDILMKVENAFLKNGFPSDLANHISNNLLLTEMCGVKSHGLGMVMAHINRWNNGGYNINPNIAVEKSTHTFSVINADNSVGMQSASFCMNRAMDFAKEEGIHIVFSKHCNTFGAAFTYTKMAADKGLIGIAFCNTPTAMAPWGGNKKLIGTNPISISIPGKNEGPILFDMATSIVAKSKFNEARKKGEPIPLGWGLDSDGKPTTDPLEAIKGFVLPMAQHKGYGLALCLDMLSGVISGSGYSDKVNRFYSEDNSCMEVGQTFIAIDPSQICDKDFYQRVDEYIINIHESGAIYPGENFTESLINSQKEGVEVPEDLLLQIENMSKGTE